MGLPGTWGWSGILQTWLRISAHLSIAPGPPHLQRAGRAGHSHGSASTSSKLQTHSVMQDSHTVSILKLQTQISKTFCQYLSLEICCEFYCAVFIIYTVTNAVKNTHCAPLSAVNKQKLWTSINWSNVVMNRGLKCFPRQLKKWGSNRRGLTRVIAAEGGWTGYSILGWNLLLHSVSAVCLSFCYVDNDTVLHVMSCQNL